MNRLWAMVVGLAAAGPAGAVSPDPKDLAVPPQELSKARELVRKLGSPVFADRERAQDDLAKMGRLAKPALVEALAAEPKPEVRARSARLIPRAEAADLQARIDTFLADADLKFDHDLPAWAAFRKQVGADKAGRDLYVAMLKSQPNLDLLVALGTSDAEGGRAVADRRVSLYLQMNPHGFGNRFGVVAPTAQPRPPTIVDVATLLLGEATVAAKDIPRFAQFGFITGQFLQQPAAMAAINNPGGTPHAEPYKLILGRWLDTRTAADELTQIVHVTQNFRQMKETTPLLRRVVTTNGVMGYAKGQALMFLVQRNAKEEQPFLRGLLKDDTVVTAVFLGNNPMGGAIQASCQLRDVALAMLLTQNGQDMRAYGFEFPQGAQPNPQNIGYGSYAFTADEKRDAALKKWEAWEAAQPKKDEKK